MDRYFDLKANGTSIGKEVTAGLTTFLTMSYIIFVNPAILSQTGMSYSAVFIATCLAASIGTLIMGIYAKLPFAQAPGMGLNAFFTFTVVFGLGYTWQEGLAIVLLSGIFFLILTITGIRRSIINAIPAFLKFAIAPGIGLFIALIGMNNAQIIDVNQGPIVDIILNSDTLDKDTLITSVNASGPQVLQFGSLGNPSVLLAIIGFLTLVVLMILKIPAAMIWSVLVTTIIGIPLGVTHLPTSYSLTAFNLNETAFQFDLSGLLNADKGILSLVVIIISFTLVDLLDTAGTLIGTADKGQLLDEDGNVPNMDKALFADASATTIGAMLGTSSVTTFLESGAGIIAGGKTGLTSVTTGLLFLLSILLAPIAGIVPSAATAPILIMVGILMMEGIKKIDLSKIEIAIPAVFLIITMPFTYSIANGIAFGLILYVLITLVQREFSKLNPVIIILVILFIMRYVLI